jgi:fatty-acyl-CoA synthase
VTVVGRVLDRALTEPGREAIVQDGTRLTAAQLSERVHGFAATLAAAGLGPGDRVAIVPTISIDAVAVRYAAALLACVTVLCPNTGVPGRLARFVGDTGARALVVFPQTAAAAAEVGGVLRLSVGAVDGAVDVRHGPAAAGAIAAAAAGALALLVASGGTTGSSKVSRRGDEAWERMVDVGPVPDRRVLICTSLAYVAQVHVDQALLGGGTVILRPRFDPADVLATVEAERVTHLVLVEPLLVELVDHPDFLRRDRSSLQAISHIGADCAPSLRRRLLARTGPILVNPYGASEVGVISVLAPPAYALDHEPDRLATAGMPLPGVDVRIERADGTAAPAGEEGLVAVTSGQLADGYTTAVAGSGFRGGRYATGDLAVVQPDGFLRVRGRAADRREIDGRSVMPIDVQDALCSHPDVRYAVALPNGDRFAAVVVLAPGARLTESELQRFVEQERDPALAPDPLVVVDRVPVTEQGKPDRVVLAGMLGR